MKSPLISDPITYSGAPSSHWYPLSPSEELFFGTTPAQRPDSPEFRVGERTMSPPNLMSLRDEQRSRDDDMDEDEDIGGGNEDEKER